MAPEVSRQWAEKGLEPSSVQAGCQRRRALCVLAVLGCVDAAGWESQKVPLWCCGGGELGAALFSRAASIFCLQTLSRRLLHTSAMSRSGGVGQDGGGAPHAPSDRSSKRGKRGERKQQQWNGNGKHWEEGGAQQHQIPTGMQPFAEGGATPSHLDQPSTAHTC